MKPKIDLESDSTPTSQPNDLKKVTEMALDIIVREEALARLQEELKQRILELERIQTRDLPALMESFGLKEFILTNGAKVVINPVTKASLPSESAIEKQRDAEKREELRDRFERGIKYLEKQGAGAIIKNFVEAELGKDSKTIARKAVSALRKLGIKAAVFRNVHPQTLTAWVRERIENGAEVDFELLSVYTGQKAEIKLSNVKPKKLEGSSSLF